MSTLKKLGHLFSKKALSLTAGVAVGSMMLGLGVFAKPASAVTIGGIELTDDGFASRLTASGDFDTSNGESVTSVLLDQDVSTYAYSSNGIVNFAFRNPILNGAGFDFALFDLDASLAEFKVTINSITRSYQSIFTGGLTDDANQFPINVARINLDDFGIISNGSITRLSVDFNTSAPPSLALVGTLVRSVPEPSAMFGILATAGLLACQRKFKLAKKA